MLSPRGWALAGTGVALLAGARAFGIVELAMLAAVCFAGVGLALLVVVLLRPRLEVHRVLRPPRVEAGQPAVAELTLRNTGQRRTPVLVAGDAFEDGRVARFVVPPVPVGESTRGAYRLPTERRGVYRVGPLTLWSQDPFGLARRPRVRLAPVSLTVYPRVHRVLPPPLEGGGAPVGGPARQARLPGGEEFVGLREYVVGDDLRRVHWRSTARAGELMLRHGESPRPAPVTLVLDTRRRAHRGESFERAVEAAASITAAVTRAKRTLRFLTTSGVELTAVRGRTVEAAVMEHLALVQTGPGQHFEESLHRVGVGRGGILVVVGGALSDVDGTALTRFAAGYGTVVVVSCDERGGASGRSAPAGAGLPGALVVAVDASSTFPVAWNQMVSRCRNRDPARR